MAQNEARVLVGDDDLCHIVDKATFDRLAMPIHEVAEPLAPPNLRLYAQALEDAGYVVLKKETAIELFLAHQMVRGRNHAIKST